MEAGRLEHGPDRAHGVGQAGVGDTADRAQLVVVAYETGLVTPGA
jgi:hypothetical protein